MMQTVWHDNGRVRAVYTHGTESTVWDRLGYSKAQFPDSLGAATLTHVVTYDGETVRSFQRLRYFENGKHVNELRIPDGPDMIESKKTGENAERVSSITVNGGRVAVISLPVTLEVNDVIIVHAEAEVTNDLAENVGVWSSLLLGDSEEATTGTEITERNGRNITPGMHHDTHVKAVSYNVQEGGDFWLVLAMRAASSQGVGDIKVEQSYGHISVVIVR